MSENHASLQPGDDSKISSTREKRRILLIEDDADIANLLQLHLTDRYDTVRLESDGKSGYETASVETWDLIILDLRLPGMDGLEVCRQLRANQDYVPILMLTSKSSELDQVLGLEMGADDYVTKPFSVLEVMSRVKAIIRRMAHAGHVDDSKAQASLSHRGIHIDMGRREVSVNGHSVGVTAKEFELLSYFMKQPGEVFSRTELLDKVWGYGHQGYEHTVNSHINRLRAKIEQDPTQPEYLVTVWGVGYKLDDS